MKICISSQKYYIKKHIHKYITITYLLIKYTTILILLH